MKKIIIAILFILFFNSIVPLIAGERTSYEKQQKLLIELFFRENCSECKAIRQEILPAIEQEFTDKCLFKKLDINDKDNYLLLSAYLEFFGTTHNAPAYIVINQNNILSGTTEIQLNLRKNIISALEHPAPSTFNYQEMRTSLLEERAQKFTLIAVFIAGLIDGINPCIFATLVFFISILISTRISSGKILAAGGVYCLACFLTYLGLGFGIFNFLNLLSSYSRIRQFLEWGTIITLCLFAIISFIDALRFSSTQKSDSILLQLPERLKKHIHDIMRNRLRNRYLLGGVFIIGILVTIIESACTGQVYIPTLVLLTKEKGIDIWLIYLIVYNIAFIIPLLIVFGAAWHGTSTISFIAWSKKHLVYSKIALGVFFLFMAVLLFLLQ